MDLRYEAFCFADPLFYDEQQEIGAPSDDFAQVLPMPADGWVTADRGVWRSLRPEGRELPGQGWKIHVSAGLDNARSVLVQVHEYCIEHRIAYKHLRSLMILLARNSKYAPRDGSAKLITIYPADDDELERVLEDLAARLEGEHGAYILSDLRYGSGPLYVRYGGFAERWVEHGGTRVLAISKPDGTLVPDNREPRFSVPDWVKIPACLTASIAARKAGDPAQFPYRVTSSLHFSNGGGVYLATRKSDGEEVVLKEARPHAGLDRTRTDAVERLRREHEVLERLNGIPGVPRTFERFTVWEHHYLAMEHMPGTPLGGWLALNYPLTRRNRTDGDLAAYTERALGLLGKLERILAAVHGRGIVFGDLHPQNVLIDPETDELSLIDFELAADADGGDRPALGAPGFRAPADRSGTEVDEYALAAFRLWFFLPLTTLLELSPAKLRGYADFVQRTFDVPEGYADAIVAGLARARSRRVRRSPPPSSTPHARTGHSSASRSPPRSWRRRPRSGPTGCSPATSSSSGSAARASATARRASCTRWTCPARGGSPSTSGGCSTRSAASRHRDPASSTARTASRTCWRTSVTTTPRPGCWPRRRSWSRRPPTTRSKAAFRASR